MNGNTLFLRLEGVLQAWGSNEAKFAMRRVYGYPSKSGVIGLLCAAMGLSRAESEDLLAPLSALRMAVRIDRSGYRWWDYHTVGAEMDMQIAGGGTKKGALLSRREYLCDASFLVILQGDPELVNRLTKAMEEPVFSLYLGRKSCPPSVPVLIKEQSGKDYPDLLSALKAVPWKPRYPINQKDVIPASVEYICDWLPSPEQPYAPETALIIYDVPLHFDPPAHRPRFAIKGSLTVGEGGELAVDDNPLQHLTRRPLRPNADYTNSEWRKVREERLKMDSHLCVLCKSPATTVQHLSYRHAGGNEQIEELRSLCRLCHDACTMLEYGMNMGMDRIDPEDPTYRERVLQKREEIIAFRSLETRRRKMAGEEE